jgi:pimeloyl-ACP methyl ester carboxylesterase
VLLHGFPSSSHQHRDLIRALGHRFHLIAPDYPGFGPTARASRARNHQDDLSAWVESPRAREAGRVGIGHCASVTAVRGASAL